MKKITLHLGQLAQQQLEILCNAAGDHKVDANSGKLVVIAPAKASDVVEDCIDRMFKSFVGEVQTQLAASKPQSSLVDANGAPLG